MYRIYILFARLTFLSVMLLIYLTAYMSILAQSDPAKVDHQIQIVYYAVGCISPITQLIKGMLVGLNLFSILCKGSPPVKSTNPGAWDEYGAPIFFLIIQSVLMFLFLIWKDHRYSFGPLKRSRKIPARDPESTQQHIATEVADEARRVTESNDGLKVIHIDKVFKSFGRPAVHAVDDLTFGVKHGEVFALIGPNGKTRNCATMLAR